MLAKMVAILQDYSIISCCYSIVPCINSTTNNTIILSSTTGTSFFQSICCICCIAKIGVYICNSYTSFYRRASCKFNVNSLTSNSTYNPNITFTIIFYTKIYIFTAYIKIIIITNLHRTPNTKRIIYKITTRGFSIIII